ncbi:hypothetical protein MtrunA17_Chr7g0226741 [Medicago truncatula]|uniref:Aminotransferase-like plant mobile domain-containing protein n=1 Tax=Medicago truncatula TaxID=3880 RepID=A0A396GVQ4_MEDTR|nr:hypothetical protein MtrunA17_Chr7g0226741 [Medicago truncatula]
MPLGEMTVTLDDVACLMHLQIEGRMLSHGKKMLRHEGATLLMRHLGVSQQEAEKICGTEACRPGDRALGGSVSLLTTWFLAHFHGFYSVDHNIDYMENYPVAAR